MHTYNYNRTQKDVYEVLDAESSNALLGHMRLSPGLGWEFQAEPTCPSDLAEELGHPDSLTRFRNYTWQMAYEENQKRRPDNSRLEPSRERLPERLPELLPETQPEGTTPVHKLNAYAQAVLDCTVNLESAAQELIEYALGSNLAGEVAPLIQKFERMQASFSIDIKDGVEELQNLLDGFEQEEAPLSSPENESVMDQVIDFFKQAEQAVDVPGGNAVTSMMEAMDKEFERLEGVPQMSGQYLLSPGLDVHTPYEGESLTVDGLTDNTVAWRCSEDVTAIGMFLYGRFVTYLWAGDRPQWTLKLNRQCELFNLPTVLYNPVNGDPYGERVYTALQSVVAQVETDEGPASDANGPEREPARMYMGGL